MTKTYALGSILRALIIAYLVTGVLLLVLALGMYKLGLGEKVVDMGIIFIYILASAIGGLMIGKSMKQRKFIWGCVTGLLYVAIIFVASLAMAGGSQMVASDGLSTLLLCMGGGTLGGMIS